MSSGDIVPEVMTTLLNRSKTGLIAIDGSKHLGEGRGVDRSRKARFGFAVIRTHVRWNIGLGTVALSVSNGSRISRNPGGRHHVNICAEKKRFGALIYTPFS